MTMSKLLRTGALFAMLCAMPCLTAISQSTSATINGLITDATGAALPHARVTAQNTDTHLTETRESNASGLYSISPLPPGNYRITVDHAGFKEYAESVTLTVGQQATVAFQLQVGNTTETVSVNGDNVLLNATNAEISNVVEQETVADLPLNGRDPSSLVYLSPGVTNILNTPAGITQSTDSLTTEQGPSAGGGQQGSTLALLDGAPNMDIYLGNMAPFPNADATQEFRAITNNFGVEYGFSPGAIISVETKSGTNDLHGGLFEFVRNGDLNASNYFTGQVDTLKRNQFGAFVGGPVRKDKLFFFANFQQTRAVYGSQTDTAYTPTAAMLNGDFSAVPFTLSAPFATVNGTPNQVNPNLFSTAAIEITKAMLPLGQVPSTGLVYTATPGVLSTYNEGTGRLDYTISNHQRLFARSFIEDYSNPPVVVDGNMVAASAASPGEIAKFYNETIGHTWLPTDKFVNVITAAWISNIVNTGSHIYTNTGTPFCLSEYINVDDPPGCYIEGLNVANSFNSNAYEPNINTRTTWFLSDHTTTSLGNHILTAGVDLAHQWDNTVTYYPASMSINFSGYVTGFTLADYLLGDVSSFQQGGFENAPWKGWQLGIYAQDEYKVRPTLTLTAGLRWEPDMAPRSLNGGAAFIPGEQSQRYPQAPLGLVYPGDPGVNASLRPSNYKYFMPRIGVAWQPVGPKTVLRAGFGIFVAPLAFSFYNEAVGIAPFSAVYNVFASASSPISFQNPWAGFAVTGGKSPFPPFTQNPNIPPSQAIFLTPITLFESFARTFSLPRTQTWTLSVEQELTRNLALHLAYVGSESYHQTVNIDLNPGIYADGGNRTTYQDFSSMYENVSIGTASYNALQATIQLKPSKGLQLQSNFTWSKVIDLQSLNDAVFNAITLADPFDVRFSRGIANYNIPFASVTSFVYELPKLAERKSVLKQIADGWAISGIWTLQSGLPFGIQGGDGNNNSGSLQYEDRANYVPGQALDVHQGNKAHWLSTYFNPSAFVPNLPGTFGNTGVDFLEGPGVNSADMAILKDWSIHDRYKLQFRCEAFNAFNRANFGQPNNNPTSGNLGQITTLGAIAPRVLQFALKTTF